MVTRRMYRFRMSVSSGFGPVGAQPNASSSPTDDHHFVAFGVGDPPAILRLVKEPATGCDGRGEARLREVRRHRELEVDAVALPAPLRLQSIELLEHQHRVQPPRIVDVDDPGSVDEDASVIDATGDLDALRTRSPNVPIIETTPTPTEPTSRHRRPIIIAAAGAAVLLIVVGAVALASDNGSQFTSREFRKHLSARGVTHRRGGYRDPESQAFIESWFGQFKKRCAWRAEWETIEQGRTEITA